MTTVGLAVNGATASALGLFCFFQKIQIAVHSNGPIKHPDYSFPTMTESIPQQQFASVSLEDPVRSEPMSVAKPLDMLYNSKKPLFVGSPNSLNRMIYSGSTLKAAHSVFIRDFDKRKLGKKSVCFGAELSDYGYDQEQPKKVSFGGPFDYGYAEDHSQEDRPAKRRRMQRRNSKTPAMLMAMSANSALDLDFLEKRDELEKTDSRQSSSSSILNDDDDNWDGGLEIAEELVKHLQQRRHSNCED